MFIIFIAHVPGNSWTLWIPARFGFSDATEIFVFCSGMASAIAFGKVYRVRGWFMGVARTMHRVWQIYWVHICLFMAIATLMAILDAWGAYGTNYVSRLNLAVFFKNAEQNFIGLLTLTYVPNYFDILPMYICVLLMLPLVMATKQAHTWLVFAVVGLVWLAAQEGLWVYFDLHYPFEFLHLPAEPWSKREWFFNPFGWQLIFFTGFMFMSGWIKAPPVRWWLILLAVIVVVLTVPFAYFKLINEYEFIRAWRSEYGFLIGKTNFGILRYVHFLALAYLAWILAGPQGSWLQPRNFMRYFVALIYQVGQQALATFVAGMTLARLAAVPIAAFGRTEWVMLGVNLFGFVCLIAVAYLVAWFKGQPWRGPPKVEGGR